MRKISCFILALLLAFSMVGCGQNPASDSNTNKPTTGSDTQQGEERVLRIAGQSWQITKMFLEEAAAAFEKDHPDVKVEIQTYADPTVISNYAIDWSSGNTPVDVVVVEGAQFLQQFIAKDLLYDFEEDLDFFSVYDESKLVPSAVEMSRVGGKLYCAPLMSEVTSVNLNTKMFREAGLVDADGNALFPTTWDEFHEFAKKMTITDANGTVQQQGAVLNWNVDLHGTLLAALNAERGSLYGDDGISVSFDNEEFRHMFEIWKEGAADGSFSIETFADTEAGRNGYKAGNVAMLVEPNGRWVEAGNEIGFENVTVCPLPGDGGSCGYTQVAAIPKCSENSDLATQFIAEQLYGEFVQTQMLDLYGKLPVVSEYFDKATAPDWGNIKSQMDAACTYPPYQDSSKFQDELRIIIQEGLTSSDSVDVTIQKLEDMIASLRK